MVSKSIAPWAQSALLSADELAAISKDDTHYELIEGELFRMAPMGFEHAVSNSGLFIVINTFVTEHDLGCVLTGEPGFVISDPGQPDTVLAPDIAFIATDRIPAKVDLPRSGFPRLVPDLVVEIASPSQFRPEMAVKARRWLEAGVRLVWNVWPEDRQLDVWEVECMAVHTLRDADELTGGAVLPGFRYGLDRLWRS